jgi:hypothetical protein
MRRENACSVLHPLKTGFGGATSSAGKTGHDLLPYDEVVRRLFNWSMWANSHWPDLGVQPPPWAEYFRPNLAWDESWGDPDASPEAPSPKVDERCAERTDKALMSLPIAHLLVIKRHYINRRHQPRQRLDEAIRALGDILG